MNKKDRSDRTLLTDQAGLADRAGLRPSRPRYRANRGAFTLFELLLAMAVFAAAAALVMPLVGGLLTDRQLVRAVNQVRAEAIRLRTFAMREGRVMKMEIGPGEGQLTISSVFSAADGLNSSDAIGAQASLLSGADQTVGAIGAMGTESQESWTLELPEEVTVKTIATSPVGGSSAIEAAAITTSDSASAATGNSPAIYFYPTGRTSNAILTISDSKSPDVYVQIRGLTGDVSVRE